MKALLGHVRKCVSLSLFSFSLMSSARSSVYYKPDALFKITTLSPDQCGTSGALLVGPIISIFLLEEAFSGLLTMIEYSCH